ncbi:putative bifunctional diguanylate cyclase/phosphodiesterase [Hansschlegelia quercus]|uniref:EAL domain-containing protein n=1 Tax=Hansschlegelia quercus TaxID=2528245 RepID=A0A4Q9GH44_9HYPH|nr:EAL domain-containing protein [Hansschlegelia quercus]TBN53342.1 EAL domain-containing protein [Hansschlegelia quercus]
MTAPAISSFWRRLASIAALVALVLGTTFILAWLWETGLEAMASSLFGIPYDESYEEEERLRFILTSTGFSAVSLLVPGVLLFLLFRNLDRTNVRLAAAQAESLTLARHDPLTGLVNRRVFSAEVVRRTSGAYALIMIDIDDFKTINDVNGHAAGDAVLCVVAERLEAVVGRGGLVARLGGDEFAAVIDMKSMHGTEIVSLVERIASSLTLPIATKDVEVTISASLGIAQSASNKSSEEAMLRAADIALYRAKREGRGLFRFFEKSMEEEIEARRSLEVDIKRGVASGEFRPYFQPLVRLADSSVAGFEVLARWEHPQLGLVMPAVFIGVAEEIGVITDLTLGVLRQACEQSRNWSGDPILSVNVSPVELKEPALALKLLSMLAETRYPPSRIEVEITEDAVMTDIDAARAFLAAVRAAGIRVALDDFGTGYSSLSKLQLLQFDKIKIDRSFVVAAERDAGGRKLINMLVGLGRSLNVETTAEGIETAQSADHLTQKGCTYGQGYYFGHPMPGDEAARLISIPARPIGLAAG